MAMSDLSSPLSSSLEEHLSQIDQQLLQEQQHLQHLYQPKRELRKRLRVLRVPPQVPSHKHKSLVHSRGQALRRASESGRAARSPSRRAAIVFAAGRPGVSGSEGAAAENDSGDIQLVTEAAPGGEPAGGGQLGAAHAGGDGDGDAAAAGGDAGDVAE